MTAQQQPAPNLKRRQFYKVTNVHGKPFWNYHYGLPDDDFAYEVGEVCTPKVASNSPSICTNTSLHACDNPEGSLLWGLVQMGEQIRNSYYNKLPIEITDEHPYGFRLFSFRGTPFDAAKRGPLHGGHESIDSTKYGFTRIRPERELDLQKFFQEPSPIAKVRDLDDDELVDRYLEFFERLGIAIFKTRRAGGLVSREISDVISQYKNGFIQPYDNDVVWQQADFDKILASIAFSLLNQVLRGLDSRLTYSEDGDDAHLRMQKVNYRIMDRFGYKRSGDNHYMLRSLSRVMFAQVIAEEVLGLGNPDALEDLTILLRERGRAIIVQMETINTKSPEFRRAMSLQRKIQNLIEREYEDLAPSVTSMQV